MASSQRRRSYYDNFLRKYPDVGAAGSALKLDAFKFAEIWQHYDSNNSGYIDDEGLDKFFKDLLMTMTCASITPELVQDLKDCFMESYDAAKDGRIAITELANILPTDENFILLFRLSEDLTSSQDLISIWKKYDRYNSGYINKDDLKELIRELLERKGKKVCRRQIDEYAEGMLKIFDKNNDGRLSLTEMARLLSIKTEENFLITSSRLAKFQDLNEKQRNARMNEIFDHYDKGNTGYLEGTEIDRFVMDLHDYGGPCDTFGQEDSMRRVEIFKQDLMKHCDLDKDNRLNKKEVRMILGFHQ